MTWQIDPVTRQLGEPLYGVSRFAGTPMTYLGTLHEDGVYVDVFAAHEVIIGVFGMTATSRCLALCFAADQGILFHNLGSGWIRRERTRNCPGTTPSLRGAAVRLYRAFNEKVVSI